MQPYFVPYAGYFRLFSAADIFVAFDCVQFPRRGWVHRNRFALDSGSTDWLTLPIRKCARETLINDLEFAPDATASLKRSFERFPLLRHGMQSASPLLELVADTGAGSVADYLCAQLMRLLEVLGISCPIVRSSTLNIASGLHGQERILAIARQLGATRYVNSPGGRSLYDAEAFAANGIELRFLSPYVASMDSILTLLLMRSAGDIAALIRRETILAE